MLSQPRTKESWAGLLEKEESTKAVRKFKQSGGVKSKLLVSPPDIPLGDDLPGAFTGTMWHMVSNAQRANENQALVAYDGVNLLGRDIHSLRGGEQLNDNAINPYLVLIERRSRQPGYPSLYLHDIHLYNGLFKKEDGWTPKVTKDVFNYDFIFFLVHTDNPVHWVLVYTAAKERKLYCWDSAFAKARADRILGIQTFKHTSTASQSSSSARRMPRGTNQPSSPTTRSRLEVPTVESLCVSAWRASPII